MALVGKAAVRGGLGQRHEGVVHLRGELAGGEQDQRARAATGGAAALKRS